MAAEFQIYNAAGVLQFDALSTPFCLYDKITFNSSAVGGPATLGGNTSSRNAVVFYTTSVNFTKANSVIAIGGSAPAFVLSQSATSATIAFQRTGADITVYAFNKYSAKPVYGPGLEIWDASGALVFGSNDQPLKPLHFQPYQLANEANDPLMNYYNPGKTLAIVQNNVGMYNHFFDDFDTPQGTRYSERNVIMCFVANSTAYAAGYRRNRIKVGNAEGAPEEFVSFVSGSATVIDVTNY